MKKLFSAFIALALCAPQAFASGKTFPGDVRVKGDTILEQKVIMNGTLTMPDGSVTTAKIANGSVTTPKLHVEALDGFDGLLRLTNTGNHGIGTASPDGKLDVTDSGNATKTSYIQNPDTTDTSSRQYLNIVAGDKTLQLGAIHNDHGYINGPSGADLFFQEGGTNRMVIQTGGNVGVGTASPGEALDVVGSVEINGGTQYYQLEMLATGTEAAGIILGNATNGINGQIYANNDGDLRLIAGPSGGYEAIVLEGGTGNVGVGTASPGEELEINSTSPVLRLRTATDAQAAAIDWNVNGTNAWIIGTNYAVASSADTLEFRGNDNGTIMAIDDSASSVGIGTASPDTELDVHGVNEVATAADGQINAVTTDGFAIDIGGQISFKGKYNTSGDLASFAAISGRKENGTDGQQHGYLSFNVNPNGGGSTERMRIDSSGNVGIGTSSPDYTLDVEGVIGGGSNVSGEYTAVVSSTANLGTYTPSAGSFRYARLGDQVWVAGRVSFAATAASDTDTEAEISLPIASDLAAGVDLSGSCSGFGTTDRSLKIDADSTKDTANVVWRADTTSSIEYSCMFMYEVK